MRSRYTHDNRKGDFTVNRKMRNRAAGALLCALVMAAPMNALAAETTALAAGAQGEPTKQGETITVCSMETSYLGVSASDKWMMQARIGGRTMSNHNRLLREIDGCVGLKTGYTQAAGRTLVSCVERDGRTLVAVTLCDGNDWADHKALYDYGFAAAAQEETGGSS